MKKWFKIVVAATLALAAWGCGEPEETGEPQLPITSANIAGVWQLTEWQGEAVSEDMVVYIEFVNVGRTYTLYQNVDSSVIDVITGDYNLYTSPSSGLSILSGKYDYSDSTEWSNRYVVRSLTATTMVLKVYTEGASSTADAESFVYTKRDSLPEGIGK